MSSEDRLRRPGPGVWFGYAACGWAWLFAVPSLYWGLGGTVGRETVGREAVTLTWGDDPLAMAVVLFTGILKVVGGGFALALAREWRLPVPRRLTLTVGWGAALLLLLYGGLNVFLQVLVGTRVIEPPADFDWWAYRWHLYLWSPWFLLWGVLLGLTVRRYQQRSRR